MATLTQQEREQIVEVARQHDVRLLVLHGSQARGDARPDSDIDLAVLAGPDFDISRFTAQLMTSLRRDEIDVVDLARAGGLLRYHIARDGVSLFDPRHEMLDFQVSALRFWFDAQHVLAPNYEAILERLP